MSYATLTVQLELGRSNAAPLRVTRILAGKMGAAVTGLAAAQPIQWVVGDGFYGADIVQQDTRLLEEEAKAAEQEFHEAMDGGGAALDWKLAVTLYPLSDKIAALTADADLIVAGIDHGDGGSVKSARQVDLGDLACQAGRPLLAVPLSVKHFDFRRALVAWKETREARRALADALPLLRKMERVEVVEIAGEADHDAARAGVDRVVGWLGRHGIVASGAVVSPEGNDADHLLSIAAKRGAELIVAGAYGHSRLREWVLGGVTRDLLRRSRRCLFLSH